MGFDKIEINLVNVSEGYIPNLGPIGPLLHVEKFVDGGWWVGGGWKTKFSVHLCPKLNNSGIHLACLKIIHPARQTFSVN